MRWKKSVMSIVFLIVVLLVVKGNVLAANNLVIETEKNILTNNEVKVSVKLVGESGEIIKEDKRVLIKISKGGLLDPIILKEGLVLKEGVGEFIYLSPKQEGKANLVAIDLSTNASARYSFAIKKEEIEADWKKEPATIAKLKGSVVFKGKGDESWNTALVDKKLYEGDYIKTWGDSWVTLRLFDGSEVVLKPWTTLKVKSLQRDINNAELKQSVFKVLTGKVVCEVKKHIAKGARFEIESESTAAGVRGTFFEYGSTIEGEEALTVYEGEVVMEFKEHGNLLPVRQGERIAIQRNGKKSPAMNEHNITAAKVRKAINQSMKAEPKSESESEPKKIEEESENKTKDFKAKKPKKEKDKKEKSSLMPDSTNFGFGSQKIGENMYMTLSLEPEFKDILGTGLGAGLNLTLYQDSESGEINLGAGDEDVKLNNIFNWVEYDGKYTYLRYGYLEGINYGYGLLLGDYYKEDARGLQLGLNNITSAKLGSRVLLPLDIKSLYPWKTESTSSLYAGRVTSDFSLLKIPFQAGVNYVTDTNEELKELENYDVPTTGASADLGIKLTSIAQPYVEVSKLNEFGSGLELGVRGSLLSFWYQGGMRVINEEFVPNYFGESYEVYKENTLEGSEGKKLADLSDYPATQGAYLKAGARLLNLADFSLGYEDYSDDCEYAPILSSNLSVDVPKLLVIPELKAGFNYRQINFDTDNENDVWLNENTDFSWYVEYPTEAGISIRVVNKFEPSNTEVEYTREIGISTPF